MRPDIINDLRNVQGGVHTSRAIASLCHEAAAILEGFAARTEAGAALRAMIDNGDTPLGKRELANALLAFHNAAYNNMRGSSGSHTREVVGAIVDGMSAVARELGG